MPIEPEVNQRTSIDDRRNNIRERIYNDISEQQKRRTRSADNRVKPEKQLKGYKAILEEERKFEKLISSLPKEEIKQKRLDRIERVKYWYQKAQISENYLIERVRQLYHNLPGDIPQFYKRPRIDQSTFNKTVGKGIKWSERKEKYDEYDRDAIKEKNDFEEARSAGKELNPDKVLDEARYKEFATTREKEIFDENERLLKEALEKLKQEHPEEYKKEMEKRAEEEKARREEKGKETNKIIAERRKEFDERIKVTKERIASEREYRRIEFEKKVARFNEKVYASSANTDFSKESAELDEERDAIGKYKEQLDFLEEHTEDLWNGAFDVFTDDKKEIYDIFASTSKESIEKDAIKKALKDELDNADLDEYESAVDKYNEKLAFLEENFDKLGIANYEDFNNRWEAKKEEEKKKETERENVPTDKKVVDLKGKIQANLLDTCSATNEYVSTRLQYGLNYAVSHNARITRAVLMPAFDELSELTVISHDVDAEYTKQSEAVQRDIKAHQKAKPWIVAKWLGVPRWKKWEKRNNELEAKRNDLNVVAQKVVEQKQLISQYVKGLKDAGVSQEMIDKCSVYERAVANTQITEEEIKNEILNCKEVFKNKIIALKEQGKMQEVARIYEERKDDLSTLKSLRSVRSEHLTKEEMSELYPEKVATKLASTRPDLRTELIGSGKMTTREALLLDNLFDFEKETESIDDVNQYLGGDQKSVHIDDMDKYYEKEHYAEYELDESAYTKISERHNQREANKTKNIVNTEEGIKKEETMKETPVSSEALGYLASFRKGVITINEDEIFADEYEFFNELGAFDVPKIKTDEDLQSSLFEKTAQGSSGLSEKVDNSKETQKVCDLEHNLNDN